MTVEYLKKADKTAASGEDDTVLFRKGDKLTGTLDVDGQRLLDENVDAGLDYLLSDG